MRLRFNPWPHSLGWGSGIAVSCGVGCRCGLDPMLLWLWCRPATVAPIRLLAWEPPCATDVALKNKQTNKQTNKNLLHLTSLTNSIYLQLYSCPMFLQPNLEAKQLEKRFYFVPCLIRASSFFFIYHMNCGHWWNTGQLSTAPHHSNTPLLERSQASQSLLALQMCVMAMRNSVADKNGLYLPRRRQKCSWRSCKTRF